MFYRWCYVSLININSLQSLNDDLECHHTMIVGVMSMNNRYIKETDFLTPSEAAFRWGIKRNTLIAALTRGRFDELLESGEVRKFTQHGSTEWYVSVKAMREIYGDENKIQIIELWQRVGDTQKPKKSVHFNRRHILMLENDQELPIEVLEKLREFDEYEAAFKYLRQLD